MQTSKYKITNRVKSKYATGAVLTQLDSNGDRYPVSFISKTFSLAERNYEIYDRESLVIIRVLEEWRHYIQGSPHTTVILSNHKKLTYYHEAKKLNWRQARWSLYLLEFDVKLVHTSGNKMVQFWKQHTHQWQKDWRIGKSKRQMDETLFSSKERTIYEIWTYDKK